jgi:NTE family protein
MKKKIGLVLTGGGARGAYQVGVLRAIYEISGERHNLFEVISGNSAGALNSMYLSSYAENWDLATQGLTKIWENIRPQNVFDLRSRTITDLGMKWVAGTMFGGLTASGTHVNYLLDTRPLRKLIDKEVDFSKITQNLGSKNLHGVSLSTTNYNSGSSVIFYQGNENIKDWSRTDRFSHRTDLNADHLMASSAIPFFFPPIQIDQSFYGDGCIRQTTPLSPAIHLGAEKILAIGIRFPHQDGAMKNLSFSPFANPTIGQIAGVMLNAIFLDSLESDVERLEKTNQLIEEAGHKEFKKLPILMLRPSRDLGKMTQKLGDELPIILRYLLKGIGVSENEGLDLLSYLAFDPSYSKPLMELGYHDTYEFKDEVLRFIDA